jgi:DNA-binding MarR family transcriptional regulator
MGRRLRVLFDERSEPIDRRIAVGLQKIGLALKHQEWAQAAAEGLSPTQGQIVAALAVEGPLTGSELAARLGVTLPTVSDAVRVLVDKGHIDKRPDPRHGRASLLQLTPRGRALARRVSSWPDFLSTALGELSPPEQEVFLGGVVKMIRSLQERGLVPTSRMCVTCRYFRPDVHEGDLPHHCAFVDAPMADRHLRIDCDEHEQKELTR